LPVAKGKKRVLSALGVWSETDYPEDSWQLRLSVSTSAELIAYHDPIKCKLRCHVKNDGEVKLYLEERKKGMPQRIAAARAGMSERTARKYEHGGKLPIMYNQKSTP